MERKLKVGIIGGTGMVGQRFVTLLYNHPWFEIASIAASGRSAGKTYGEAVEGRWSQKISIPANVSSLIVKNAEDVESVSKEVDFVFCAVDMDKEATKKLEEAYAKAETPVVSNNSAHRWTPDVPMVIPEINDSHLEIIEKQKARLGTKNGFIAVKPNCSIQSYVPAVNALMQFKPEKIFTCTYRLYQEQVKLLKPGLKFSTTLFPLSAVKKKRAKGSPLRFGDMLRETE